MEKQFLMSKTVWGGILIAIETALLQIESGPLWLKVVVGALGAFLTIYGFRDAMKS